ncbi:MAG: vWA domain-containing protein [Chitinophagaceae bacterium]
MSHVTGTLQTLAVPLGIGPNFGSNSQQFTPAEPPAPLTPPGGIKFVILHFTGASFPGNNRLEIDLGYDTDVFTAADGTDFWTRPVNVSALPGAKVTINYIVDGGAGGGVSLVNYGRGERHEGEGLPGHEFSYSNSDPFLTNGNYTEPDYDEFWYCNTPPNVPPDWENVACLPSGDIRKTVARSACMFVGVHSDHVSTCSGTLIGADLVIMAAHCIDSLGDLASASVIFNYETNCDGSKPAGYNAKFFKVIKALNHGTLGVSSELDYIIMQIKVPPGGLGITPIPIRTTYPAPGEQVFGIHHPNGAVKKVSKKHSVPFATVKPYTNSFIRVNTIDVSGGSSGSGLFDMAGKFVGVLSNGTGCDLSYAASPLILSDIASTPLPSPARDVYIVFDRSGSMSMDAGTDGDTKLEEAKDAADLFVNLVKAGAEHKIGLISFSTTATHDKSLTTINSIVDKQAIKGPPGGIQAIAAGGNTSIGDGLEEAAAHFPSAGTNKRTILLLTDGLQNTPPTIENALGSLGNTDITAIGFGTESSLNGALLTSLAQTHNGLYMRAGDGLDLRKFFSLSFGNIFETGALLDPEYLLPANQHEATPIPFSVCEEATITIVLGWDKMTTPLTFRIKTPSGKTISLTEDQLETARGRKWRFARLELPHDGDQSGTWQVLVARETIRGEFATAPPAVRFFVNVTVKDGPTMHLINRKTQYYTGATINPLVSVVKKDGFAPENAKIKLVVKKPANSTGNILSKTGLKTVTETAGDTLTPLYATLQALELEQKKPVIDYTEETFDLFDDGAHEDGGMEPDGIFGLPIKDLLNHAGNYTFHALASYGDGCIGTRELTWTVHVETGIDSSQTTITSTLIKTLADGRQQYIVVFTPKDKYGNLVGPGRIDSLTVGGAQGSSTNGNITDLNNGSYQVAINHDPSSGSQPGIVITQGNKAPVVISSPATAAPGGGINHWQRWFWILLILFLILLLFLAFSHC